MTSEEKQSLELVVHAADQRLAAAAEQLAATARHIAAARHIMETLTRFEADA